MIRIPAKGGATNPGARSLSDLGDRSEHGGRVRSKFHDFEAHSRTK